MVGMRGSLPDRFWPKVAVADPDDCWLWLGAKDEKGYGRIRSGGVGEKMLLAHRASWLLEHGSLPPDKLLVCHHCDNPSCVNPHHFFLGTHKDNTQDSSRKGRAHPGSKHGIAKLNEAKVREILTDSRSCKVVGRAFGVSGSVIHSIRKGETWRHVERPN